MFLLTERHKFVLRIQKIRLMKKYIVLLSVLFLFSISSVAQTVNDTLTGLVNNELIKINRNDGGITYYTPLMTVPSGSLAVRLTWMEPQNCYYSVNSYSGSSEIARITVSGNYNVVGTVTVPGQTVYWVEAIAYNPQDSCLYVSANLDGPSMPNQSHYLLKVDTLTYEGTIIGTFSHSSPYEPEADRMTFGDDGTLYYEDSQPGSWYKIFKQDIGFTSAPVLIYDVATEDISDLAVKDGYLYYSANRELRKIDLTSYTHTPIGTMFTSSDFAGKVMYGLSDWKSSSQGQANGLEEIADKDYCTIYPNPAIGQFSIKTIGKFEFEIYSMAGEKIKFGSGIDETVVNTDNFDIGTYAIRVTHINGITIIPLVVIK